MYKQSLLNAHYAEWSGGVTTVWSWKTDQVLEAGWMGRRATYDARGLYYFSLDSPPQQSSASENGWKHDMYAQEAASLFNNRVHLLGGLRFDTATIFDAHPVSPQISTAVQLARDTLL